MIPAFYGCLWRSFAKNLPGLSHDGNGVGCAYDEEYSV